MPNVKVRGGREKARRFRRECKNDLTILSLDLMDCCQLHNQQIQILLDNLNAFKDDIEDYRGLVRRLTSTHNALVVISKKLGGIYAEIKKFKIFVSDPDMDTKAYALTNQLMEVGTELSSSVHEEIQHIADAASQSCPKLSESIGYAELLDLDKKITAMTQGSDSTATLEDILGK
jgi:hypothetical protein